VDHGQIDGPPGVQELDNGGEHALMAPADVSGRELTIHLHLAYGQIKIERAACPGGAVVPTAGESTLSWKGSSNVAAACN